MSPARALGLLIALLAAGLPLGGCSGDSEPATTLDKAARDSVLAASPLPGAGTVRRALDIADTAAARAERIDAAGGR